MIYVDNIEESYPVKFGKLLELVIVDILNSGFKRTKNPGAPYYFSENHLRKHFSIFIENTKDANLFPKLVIERKIIGDFKSSNREHGGTDYFYVNSLSENYNSSDVLATYEVKGPTRPILFKGSKVNWYPKIIEDIKKQAWRNLNFPNKENYIVLIINSPKNIDYMSIDTEGNEYDIIKNINFSKWKIKIITIEHNFDNNNKKKIYKFLTKNNYKRVHSSISYMDDWYVLKSN